MRLSDVLAEEHEEPDDDAVHGENVFELTELSEQPDEDLLRHVIKERGLGITYNYRDLTNVGVHVEDEWKRRAESYHVKPELDMHVMTIGNTAEDVQGYYHFDTKALTFIGRWKIVLIKNGIMMIGTSADRQTVYDRYGAIVTAGAKGYVHMQVVSPKHVEKKWAADRAKLDLKGLFEDLT